MISWLVHPPPCRGKTSGCVFCPQYVVLAESDVVLSVGTYKYMVIEKFCACFSLRMPFSHDDSKQGVVKTLLSRETNLLVSPRTMTKPASFVQAARKVYTSLGDFRKSVIRVDALSFIATL